MEASTGDNQFNRSLGARLRAARRGRGMSLSQVEAATDGEFKASVVGAYERGERALSVHRLVRLASVYGVEVHDLLPEQQAPAGVSGNTVIDLDVVEEGSEIIDRFIAAIQLMRRNGGKELAVRRSDLAILASLVDVVPQRDAG